MKLKFKAHKLISFEKERAIEKTKVFLRENNYHIVKATEFSISFNSKINSWKLVSNSLFHIRMTEGQFDISESSGQTFVDLTFFVSIGVELIQLCIIVFASTYMGYKVLFLAVIFILNFGLKVVNTKSNLIGNIMYRDL